MFKVFHRITKRYPFIFTLGAVLVGVGLAQIDSYWINQGFTLISEIFIRILKLLSLPLIFLSLFVTISGMANGQEAKKNLVRVFSLTLLTTIIAACVALGVYLLVDPARSVVDLTVNSVAKGSEQSYLQHMISVIPSNFLQPFLEGNVVGILIVALLLSFATLALKEHERIQLHQFFSSIYAAIMKITAVTVHFIPLAVCAFVYLFARDMKATMSIAGLGLYLSTLLVSNLLQGIVILPIILMVFGISPIRLFRGMLPALSVAFFSKSSCATMPMAIQCAEERVGISPAVARFTYPLCTTINMNACAAFIIITTLYVAQNNGVQFSFFDMILWVFIATIAAVGNAGVPMGCYFLTSALLTTMDVPLGLMGVILPFYALIDMLETAINIWSDSCVTAIVDKRQEEFVELTS